MEKESHTKPMKTQKKKISKNLKDSADFFPNDEDGDNFFFGNEKPDFSSVLGDALHSSHPESMPTKDDLTNSFFNGLLVRDEREQKRSLNHISKLLKESLYKSESQLLICTHLSRIVRLATETPFQTIRSFFMDFLNEIRPELERLKIAIPEPVQSPSIFFPAESVIPIDTVDEEAIQIFQETFLRTGRVSHIARILAWHPIYYRKHSAAYSFIMCSPINPLSRPYCHYLAIMAATSFKCSYLVQDQIAQFLSNKGQEKWLDGYSNLPLKLKNLFEVNAILAHQPWRIKSEHIERLLKGQDAWSLPELVHAFIVLACYRALAAFVWGMGITSEIDFKYKANFSSGTQSYSTFDEEQIEVDTNTSMLINKLCQISGEMLHHYEDEALEKKVELFAAAGQCKLRKTDTPCSELESNGWTAELSNKFSEPSNSNLTYVDFDVKSTEYSIFHVQDFSWGTHGFSLVKRYYSSAANLLDECFKCIRNLTYQSFHDQKEVETGPFRMAIWYYVHRVFGIFHDDFDYSKVNNLVSLSIKSYIKIIACMPFRMNASLLSNFNIHLKPQEKAHIALLVMEARKQSEIIYGLHAINKYLSNS